MLFQKKRQSEKLRSLISPIASYQYSFGYLMLLASTYPLVAQSWNDSAKSLFRSVSINNDG
jgi:hypothetical protein